MSQPSAEKVMVTIFFLLLPLEFKEPGVNINTLCVRIKNNRFGKLTNGVTLQT